MENVQLGLNTSGEPIFLYSNSVATADGLSICLAAQTFDHRLTQDGIRSQATEI